MTTDAYNDSNDANQPRHKQPTLLMMVNLACQSAWVNCLPQCTNDALQHQTPQLMQTTTMRTLCNIPGPIRFTCKQQIAFLQLFARWDREGATGRGWQVNTGSIQAALGTISKTIALAGFDNHLYWTGTNIPCCSCNANGNVQTSWPGSQEASSSAHKSAKFHFHVNTENKWLKIKSSGWTHTDCIILLASSQRIYPPWMWNKTDPTVLSPRHQIIYQ